MSDSEVMDSVGLSEDIKFISEASDKTPTDNKKPNLVEVEEDKPLEPEEKPKEVIEEEEEAEPKKEEKKEEEEEESEIEDSDIITSRPTWSQINKEFPEFFKKFPQMKHIIGREMAYSQVFPTVEEAEESKDDSDKFEYLNTQFESGNIDEISKLMKETSTEAYDKFVDGFLPRLATSDSQAFYRITAPVIHNLLNQVYTASKGKNENLQNAALVIAEHLFGDERTIETPLKIEQPKEAPKDTEKEDFYKQRLLESRQEVNDVIVQELQDLIFDEFTSQFPEGKIPSELNETITDLVESSVRKIDTSLSLDETHKAMMSSLWKRAFKSGFTGDWKDRIINAYLSRAKELIPGQRKKVMPFVPRKRDTSSNGAKIPSGSSSKGGPRNYSARDIDWSKTSDMDFLDGNIKLKGE